MKASELGINPYVRNARGSVEPRRIVNGGMADPRAPGFDGTTIDQLVRDAWTRGSEIGQGDGHREASASYGDIYDNGFELGFEKGAEEGARVLGNQLLPLLRGSVAALGEVSRRSHSATLIAVADKMLTTISASLDLS